MRKVLHVVSCLEMGGTEAYIMNNYRNAERESISFDFASFTEHVDAYKTEIEALGGKVFVVGLPKITRMHCFVWNLVNCIKQNGPYDVVHSHVNITNAWVMLAAAIAGVPMRISHSHAKGGK